MTNTNTADRDRLYFQHERERLAALQEMELEAARLTDELLERLDAFDELDEAVGIETDGASIRHAFTGDPVPWLQQRRSEARMLLAAAARRLEGTARDLEAAARSISSSGRLDHIARGHLALAAEATRVAESFGPGREPLQIDWGHTDGIRAGLRHLEERQATELREDILQVLSAHDQQQRSLRAAGLNKLADRLCADPLIRRALRTMWTFAASPLVGSAEP